MNFKPLISPWWRVLIWPTGLASFVGLLYFVWPVCWPVFIFIGFFLCTAIIGGLITFTIGIFGEVFNQ